MAQDNLKILVGAVAGAMLLLIVLVLGKICSMFIYVLFGKKNELF